MINFLEEECLLLFKGEGEGHIGVRIRGVYSTMEGDMESNNRRNVFALDESLMLLSTIS